MKLPNKATSEVSFAIKMIPLIDVIFLLMIFFVMTIRFQEPEGILENRLPERDGRVVAEHQKDWEVVRLKIRVVITEGDNPKIYLQERVISTYAELVYYLNQLPREILLVIEPEAKVLYKHVIGVYNACLKSKKTNIVFAIAPR